MSCFICCYCNVSECDCFEAGKAGCDLITGSCECKVNTLGSKCDKCVDGYKMHPVDGCMEWCNCFKAGTKQCNTTGHCICKTDMTLGASCDKCLNGNYMDPVEGCSECDNCPVDVGGDGTCTYGKFV